MFKKFIFSISLSLLPFATFSAHAVQFKGVGENTFEQSSNNLAFTELKVTADSDDEITAEHGITISIPDRSPIQWDTGTNDNITISGEAAGKVIQPVVPVISENLYHLNIKVSENFKAGDSVTIKGLTPRTFRESVSERFLTLDVTGDNLPETSDFFRFSVRTNDKTDFIPPHPVTNAKLEYNNDTKKMTLSWKNPFDYDYVKTLVSKKLGDADVEVYSNTGEMVIDNTYIQGQEAVYEIFTNDKEGNLSEKVTLKYPPEAEKEEEVQPEPETPTEEVENSTEQPEEQVDPTKDKEQVKSEEEIADLGRLKNYYRIRYQIKCLRPGISPLDSNCLWSKINFVYAQELLKEVLMDVSLTANEIGVIAKRIRFSEARYQENCVEADSPAKYCAFLGKSLKRARYFVDHSSSE